MELYNNMSFINFIEFNNFSIGSEASLYRLNLNTKISGNLIDFSYYHNGQGFTTYDWDNDNRTLNCAVHNRGGWWMNACFTFCLTCENVTGHYKPSLTANSSQFLFYNYIKMMIK